MSNRAVRKCRASSLTRNQNAASRFSGIIANFTIKKFTISTKRDYSSSAVLSSIILNHAVNETSRSVNPTPGSGRIFGD